MPARLLAALSLLATGATAIASPITSTFDVDAEGWAYRDFAGLGDYTTVLGGGNLDWAASGGNPEGQVSLFDPSTGSFFFQASALFLGDRSDTLGQSLSFDVRTDFDTYGTDNAVLLVGNGGQMIASPITQPLVNSWQTFTVPLQAANFRYDNLSGAVVGASDFAAILGDLEAIYIPGEFASGVIERTLLDNVVLVPEPSSLCLTGVALLLVHRRR